MLFLLTLYFSLLFYNLTNLISSEIFPLRSHFKATIMLILILLFIGIRHFFLILFHILNLFKFTNKLFNIFIILIYFNFIHTLFDLYALFSLKLLLYLLNLLFLLLFFLNLLHLLILFNLLSTCFYFIIKVIPLFHKIF